MCLNSTATGTRRLLAVAIALALLPNHPAQAQDSAPTAYRFEYHFALTSGIGNGSAVLLVGVGGPSLMFDVGDIPFGESLPAQLEALGLDSVNVILSHCHPDHASGILPLLANRPDLVTGLFYPQGENFPDCLLAGINPEDRATYAPVVEAYRNRFRHLNGKSSALTRRRFGASLAVIQPVYDPLRVPKVSLNDRSLTLCLDWPNGDTSLLFGDTSRPALNSLLQDPVFLDCLRRADVLLANHHGNSIENSNGYLEQMRQIRAGRRLDLVVISSQRQSAKGDANAERIRIGLNAARWLRTAYGTIRVKCASERGCKATQPVLGN